jgi:hypothetical protein
MSTISTPARVVRSERIHLPFTPHELELQQKCDYQNELMLLPRPDGSSIEIFTQVRIFVCCGCPNMFITRNKTKQNKTNPKKARKNISTVLSL